MGALLSPSSSWAPQARSDPQPLACSRVSTLNQHISPAQLFHSCPNTSSSAMEQVLGPSQPQGQRGCPESGQGDPGWHLLLLS